MRKLALFGAASVALGVACASSGPVPADRLAQSQASIRSAQELGAANIAPAAVHLKVAGEQLDIARKLIADGENKRADLVLLRAEADANVAIAFAREVRAREDAQRTLNEVQKLKNSRPEGT